MFNKDFPAFQSLRGIYLVGTSRACPELVEGDLSLQNSQHNLSITFAAPESHQRRDIRGLIIFVLLRSWINASAFAKTTARQDPPLPRLRRTCRIFRDGEYAAGPYNLIK